MKARKPKAEIRRTRSKQFYYTLIATNGEPLSHSEPHKNKSDTVGVVKEYHPNFRIVDMTHLKPLKVIFNIILE